MPDPVGGREAEILRHAIHGALKFLDRKSTAAAILSAALDVVRSSGPAAQNQECTCAPTTGTDYEPHDPSCPKSARSPKDEDQDV